MSNKQPLSLYVHMPYCKKKCLYCDFVSFTDRLSTAEKYCDAVIDELSQYDLGEYEISTLFFGGGTPSAVPCGLVKRIIDAVSKKCSMLPDAEITLECNPCTLDYQKLKNYYSFGVNRLSIGVQSFDDGILKTLGRLHDADTAKRSILLAKNAGFDNISIDLMFSIPGQTEDMLISSLNECISLDVKHVSLYSLILEDGTRLCNMVENGQLERIGDDVDRNMYGNACRLLHNAGYEQYEISNFAKPGFESRHNTAYWKRKEYIGLGCAAHSFFKNVRYSNTESLDDYLSGVDIAKNIDKGDFIDKNDAAEETVMLSLRMNEGISISNFRASSGFDITEKCSHAISRLQEESLLIVDGDRIFVTDRGRDVLNYVIVQLVSEF